MALLAINFANFCNQVNIIFHLSWPAYNYTSLGLNGRNIKLFYALAGSTENFIQEPVPLMF